MRRKERLKRERARDAMENEQNATGWENFTSTTEGWTGSQCGHWLALFCPANPNKTFPFTSTQPQDKGSVFGVLVRLTSHTLTMQAAPWWKTGLVLITVSYRVRLSFKCSNIHCTVKSQEHTTLSLVSRGVSPKKNRYNKHDSLQRRMSLNSILYRAEWLT